MTEVNHEPGPRITQSASRTAAIVSGADGGSCGSSAMLSTVPLVVATATWPRKVVRASGSPGSRPCDPAVISSGTAAIGSTRPRALRSRPTRSSPTTGSLVQVPEGGDEEVAEGVTGERSLAPEPVLQHVPPGVAPLGVVAQRGQRHPQVTWGQHVELVAQPARRPPVVGDRDHGGDVVGDELEGLERGRETVATPEGDDRRPAHSCPRSRWTTKVAMSSLLSRARSASATATERCLPPVQPTASVT